MRIEIHGINFRIGDGFRSLVEKKLEKFHRFFDDNALCTVKAQAEHEEVKVELTIKLRRNIYRAEAVAEDSQAALVGAISNLERKIRKHKTRLKRRKQSDKTIIDYLADVPEFEEEAEEAPQIIRRKQFAIEPMDPEEAALQMELIDHDFFLYLNPDTGKVAVLYKRHDGDYGILEPEY